LALPAVVLVHGSEDATVPTSASVRMFETLQRYKKIKKRKRIDDTLCLLVLGITAECTHTSKQALFVM
jgi:hypothetical protein